MKEIKNCPGYYVTQNGEVFSCIKKNYNVKGAGSKSYIDESFPIKLTPYIHNKNGYVYVSLGKYGKKRLHRLVAESYIPNPDDLPEVNHLDREKTNNKVSNLEWCNRQKNAEHSLSKCYIVENVKTGERIEVYNLSKFCRENDLMVGSLNETIHQKRRKQHKGWKVVKILEKEIKGNRVPLVPL
jgi:hypothetical protein